MSNNTWREQLKEKYPWMTSFSVGDGWRSLIEDLAENINALREKLSEEEKEQAYLSCCKQKFGGLRFYLNPATDEMFFLVDEAEHKSFSICENCGSTGVPRIQSWVRALCDSCFDP